MHWCSNNIRQNGKASDLELPHEGNPGLSRSLPPLHCGVCSDEPRFLLDPRANFHAWIYIRTQQLNHRFDYSQSKTAICTLHHHASTTLQTCFKAFEGKHSLCDHWKAAHDHTSVVRLERPIERQQLAHRRGASHCGNCRVILSRAYATKSTRYVVTLTVSMACNC